MGIHRLVLRFLAATALATALGGCASGSGAPAPRGSAAQADQIARGEYLTGLLGCEGCHTQGMLINAPDPALRFAGSDIGIVFTAYRPDVPPGIVFPANLTPDKATGIGGWSRDEIVRNIRYGIDRHGRQQLPVMPWPGYAHLETPDAEAIAAYLMSLPPVRHAVPKNVEEGEISPYRYVRYGIYVFEPSGEVRQVHRPGTGLP